VSHETTSTSLSSPESHMADNSPEFDLEALDAYLMSDASPDNCMMLSDLDGLLTGIVVAPELIPPSEWMSAIWGGEEPEFESERRRQTVLGTIMGRYNEIVAVMNSDPDSFDPIFERWPDGEVVVTDWAAGFLDAIKLRHKAWEPLFKHPRAKLLVEPLIILGDDENFFGRSTPEPERRFYASRQTVIPTCVIGINDFWRDWQSRRKPQPRRNRGRR